MLNENKINCLIVTGGGEFANLIRHYDSEINFSSEITHETAIESMDIIAKLLNDKFDFTELVYSLDNVGKYINAGNIPILSCSNFLKENNNIPHSWDLTSDSISAYVSNLLKAKLLIVTNVDGIYTREPSSAESKFIGEIDAKKLLICDETSVDLMLGDILLQFGFNCFVVNGNFPERVLYLIEGENNNKIVSNDYKNDYNFKYTFIRGE